MHFQFSDIYCINIFIPKSNQTISGLFQSAIHLHPVHVINHATKLGTSYSFEIWAFLSGLKGIVSVPGPARAIGRASAYKSSHLRLTKLVDKLPWQLKCATSISLITFVTCKMVDTPSNEQTWILYTLLDCSKGKT